MQCPTCGATLPDDARFCGGCGTDLVPPSEPVQPASPAAAWSPAATPPPYPTSPVPPPGYPPAPGYQMPGAPPPAPRTNTGLIVGIVVLLAAAGLIGVFVVLPAMNPGQPAKNTTSTQPSTGATSGPSQTPTATQSETTNPEPPPSELNPEPATPTLSEATASELVIDYLSKAQAGDAAGAKALVTSKYISRITSDYYEIAAKDLLQYEVAKVEQGQGGYTVFMKESWSSGTWTNWYLVVLKDASLVIDDTGTE